MRFGPGFKRPSAKVLRLHRAEQGAKLFMSQEVRQVVAAAKPAMKAVLLLGINAGFGNSDCGNLPLSALDLERGILDFPRPTTGIPRRCALGPETVQALKEALAKRPAPKREEDAGLVFITKYGQPWAKDEAPGVITKARSKLLKELGIHGHRNFYTLRHTFRTGAAAAKEQPAADFILGHESPHLSSSSRATISDARLKAVTDHVRQWLFGQPPQRASSFPPQGGGYSSPVALAEPVRADSAGRAATVLGMARARRGALVSGGGSSHPSEPPDVLVGRSTPPGCWLSGLAIGQGIEAAGALEGGGPAEPAKPMTEVDPIV
jgi:hypothetical protein